jgi:hypothetical protein
LRLPFRHARKPGPSWCALCVSLLAVHTDTAIIGFFDAHQKSVTPASQQ